MKQVRLPHHNKRRAAAVLSPDTDWVVVVGAGAAGMAAAISAARCGAAVCLVEKSCALGGTVTQSLIHTIGGLYDVEGNPLHTGLPIELAERLVAADKDVRQRKIGRAWTLSVDPAVYGKIVAQWLESEQRILIWRNSIVNDLCYDGKRIVGLRVRRHGREHELLAKAVIDTTGGADIIRMVDPALVIEEGRAAAGMIFSLTGVAPGALDFPKGVEVLARIRGAARDGLLPAECGQAWLDQGVVTGEVYVKLQVPLDARWRQVAVRAMAVRRAHHVRDVLLGFLHTLPEFASARLLATGKLGIRDGGRIVGEYRLSVEDVRAGRHFADGVAKCAWPIEYWNKESGVSLEYLPESIRHYEIPLRAFKVRGWDNLWGAGKCLSADHLAQASARVAGCCWAMGEAVGRAAALG